MQSLTASTPCKPRNGFAFRSSLSICESFVNYCNLLLQFIKISQLVSREAFKGNFQNSFVQIEKFFPVD